MKKFLSKSLAILLIITCILGLTGCTESITSIQTTQPSFTGTVLCGFTGAHNESTYGGGGVGYVFTSDGPTLGYLSSHKTGEKTVTDYYVLAHFEDEYYLLRDMSELSFIAMSNSDTVTITYYSYNQFTDTRKFSYNRDILVCEQVSKEEADAYMLYCKNNKDASEDMIEATENPETEPISEE